MTAGDNDRSLPLLQSAIARAAGVTVAPTVALVYTAALGGLLHAIGDLLSREGVWPLVVACSMILLGIAAVLVSLFLFLWFLETTMRSITWLSEHRADLGKVGFFLVVLTGLAVTAALALISILWLSWDSWIRWIPIAVAVSLSWSLAGVNIVLEGELGPPEE